jgi:hypothetical protein
MPSWLRSARENISIKDHLANKQTSNTSLAYIKCPRIEGWLSEAHRLLPCCSTVFSMCFHFMVQPLSKHSRQQEGRRGK